MTALAPVPARSVRTPLTGSLPAEPGRPPRGRRAIVGDMTAHTAGPQAAAGGPALPQARRLVTEIPGPASRELLARRSRSDAAGVSHVLPVFVTAAAGGVLEALPRV